MVPIYSKFIDCYVFRRVENTIKFLLLYRNENELYPSTWQSIQGKIKHNEKAFEAAKRELFEETGIESKNFWNLDFQNSYYFPKTNEMYLFPVFVAEVEHENVQISKEHSAFKWFSYEEAIENLIWRCQKKSIEIIYEEFFIHPNKEKLEFTKL